MDITAPRFTDENAARDHLESLQWPTGPFCPHCGSLNATRLEGTHHRAGLIQCNDCRKQYTVTVGTVFERSKVPLNKWLLVNHLLCSSKKGMSAHQIARMIGVSYKTAWFMMHRIREAMKDADNTPVGGSGKIVEADETYVGGKASNRHAHLRGKGPGLAQKQAVVSLVERGGKVRSQHVAKVTGPTLRATLVAGADRASWLMTDDHAGYKKVGKEFAGHASVSHSTGEYGRLGVIHSNTVENFFSILKRGIIGVYHHVSEAHLQRYATEFDFRYNTKDMTDFERSDEALIGIKGKRLTYRRTSQAAHA
ncbi:IS1595 family transposase [Altererythrobacter sp. ZODW24]|uniref:IS1595 family transposase n=1 Tax=Altererythrobacter sp. ZODW24 TaxID=2185142 RepID=UPI000DF7E94B|nr:IS1595 family transposase [Altererythrobacter sp. ZODW24]